MKKRTKKNKISIITSNRNNTAKNIEKITESLIKSIKKKEHLNKVNHKRFLIQISKKKQIQIDKGLMKRKGNKAARASHCLDFKIS